MGDDHAEIARLRKRLSDYVHYAYEYGNASGECETGYPQQSGLICARCGQDRSREHKCGRQNAEGRHG